MARIGEASAIYLGEQVVSAAYMGDQLVWEQPTEPSGVYDQENLIEQWHAADASGAGEGQLVPAWAGHVNGMIATNETAGRQPHFFGGVQGLPALLFAGNVLNTPRFASPLALTVYVKVCFASAPAGTQTLACQDEGGNARSWHCGVNATNKARHVNFNNGVGGTTAAVAGAPTVNTWQIVQITRNPSAENKTGPMWAAHNGEESAEALATNVLTSELYMSIGGRGAYSEMMNGYINEVRAYRSHHNASMRAIVRAEMGL